MKLTIPRIILFSVTMTALWAVIVLFRQVQTPEFDNIKSNYLSSDRVLLDRNGEWLNEIRVNKQFRRLNWVSLDEVPRVLTDLLVLAEDKRFYSHHGVDPLALANSLSQRFFSHGSRGASTVSMQIVTQLHNNMGSRWRRSTWQSKILQTIGALKLDYFWTKSQQLETYLNLVFYRSELQGLASASYGIFDKSPRSLTAGEAAILVALIRSPNADTASVVARACALLKLAPQYYDGNCDTLNEKTRAALNNGYQIRPTLQLAPFLAKHLPPQSTGSYLSTTLDKNIQKVATQSLQTQISALMSQNMNDGAVVVLDNASGDVLAYVGNIGNQSTASYVDIVLSQRQAGSTLKPFIYASAIDQKLLTAASVLKDSPLGIAVTSGVYQPTNFDKHFRDFVSVRTSLASSLNIPAVLTLQMLGVDSFVQTLHDLGFTGLQRPEFYGPSLALGSADIRLLELTNAYRTLANGGLWSPIRFASSTEAPITKRIFSEAASFVVSDILSDRESRATTFGLENTLSTRFWAAAKTGTSKDMRDNWCIGYSRKYTVGVWAGNISGQPMFSVSGIQGAAPVWLEVMNALHRNDESPRPTPPEDVVLKKVTFAYNKRSAQEFFLKGTEPTEQKVNVQNEIRSRITYPLNAAVIALDPNIPKKNSRVFIQIAAPEKSQSIYINGTKVAKAKEFIPWFPTRGKNRLELKNANGQTLDEVHFEVRL